VTELSTGFLGKISKHLEVGFDFMIEVMVERGTTRNFRFYGTVQY